MATESDHYQDLGVVRLGVYSLGNRIELTGIVAIDNVEDEGPNREEENSNPTIINDISTAIDRDDGISTSLDEVMGDQLDERNAKTEQELASNASTSHGCTFKEPRVIIDIDCLAEIEGEACS